jgi:hypothetical protein
MNPFVAGDIGDTLLVLSVVMVSSVLRLGMQCPTEILSSWIPPLQEVLAAPVGL